MRTVTKIAYLSSCDSSKQSKLLYFEGDENENREIHCCSDARPVPEICEVAPARHLQYIKGKVEISIGSPLIHCMPYTSISNPYLSKLSKISLDFVARIKIAPKLRKPTQQ
jgi:hypothetical protein